MKIRREWKKAAKRLGLEPDGSVQYMEMRKAFYAGCSATLVYMAEELPAEDELESITIIQNMFHQISVFWDNECKVWDKMQAAKVHNFEEHMKRKEEKNRRGIPVKSFRREDDD